MQAWTQMSTETTRAFIGFVRLAWIHLNTCTACEEPVRHADVPTLICTVAIVAFVDALISGHT